MTTNNDIAGLRGIVNNVRTTSLEVFPSEYDETLYIMPEGVWEGRGGRDTVAVVPAHSVSRDEYAALIVAAVNALPALLDRLERAEAVVEAAGRMADAADADERMAARRPLREALAAYDQEKARD
jgi:hypothetical protein